MSTNPEMIDAAYVMARLQEASRAVAAIPGVVGPKNLGAQSYGYVAEIAGVVLAADMRRAMPDLDRAAIGRMDEALSWYALIASNVRRRIVAARSVVHPVSEREVFSWAKIASMVGADFRSVKAWHKAGVAEIVKALVR